MCVFYRCFLCFLFVMSLSLPVRAAEVGTGDVEGPDGVSSNSLSDDDSSVSVDVLEGVLSDLPTYSEESPLPVQIVPAEDVLPDLSVNSEVPEVVIGDEPPSDPVFYGSCWVTGTDSRLGTVTVYFPIDCREGVFGIDSNGYLFNISDSSYSGYCSDTYNNSVSAGGFDYPSYRLNSGSSWDYYDLHLIPTDSNMRIATSMSDYIPVSEFLPYLLILFGGVVILCFMKRS